MLKSSACCSTDIRSWPASLGYRKLQLQYTAGWSAACSCPFSSYLAVRLLMPLLSSLMRLCLSDARSLLKAGVGTIIREHRIGLPLLEIGVAQLPLPRPCSSGTACSSILACRSFNEILPMAPANQLSSGHRRLLLLASLKDACSRNGAHQVVALQEPCWQYVAPSDQVHDGDDHGNVNIYKSVLMGNCILL